MEFSGHPLILSLSPYIYIYIYIMQFPIFINEECSLSVWEHIGSLDHVNKKLTGLKDGQILPMFWWSHQRQTNSQEAPFILGSLPTLSLSVNFRTRFCWRVLFSSLNFWYDFENPTWWMLLLQVLTQSPFLRQYRRTPQTIHFCKFICDEANPRDLD